jgi:archaellum component FlaD/FlaE
MRIKSLFSNRRFRFLTLAIIIVGLVAGTGLFSDPTLSCPGPPPRPLRQLYLQSEKVVIAHLGKSEVVKEENNEGDDDNGLTQMKSALLVSSTLKGEHQPVVYVRHFMYGEYKDRLSSASADDTLLVFLTREPDADDYEVDMDNGVKILSDADLKVYISRIDELASMMKAGKPSDAEIVEWLVRCSEEPATRWEGAYELMISQYMLDQQTSENDNPDAREVSIDPDAEASVENTSENEEETDGVFRYGFGTFTKAAFAKLLTTEQKYRLGTALTGSETLKETDYILVDLVQRWGDARLVPFLLAQLDRISRPGENVNIPRYYMENMMTIVANELGDDALKEMVKRISENSYQQEYAYDDEEDTSEEAEDTPDVDASQDAENEEAENAANQQRLNTELQYFVMLASSTAPKTTAADNLAPVMPTEP